MTSSPVGYGRCGVEEAVSPIRVRGRTRWVKNRSYKYLMDMPTKGIDLNYGGKLSAVYCQKKLNREGK